ncbi:sushi, von Willebrand factor type A, EGF and pentraxin domain-containing protein 1-like isoform X2 [Haliotis asinina]|uniref:sushi, von Willebrand factor type A, EGF and pentraxin domain-containing protein 1-like isoform X2 n=1 Tax=Haliotis asinina TaxID=109174 RepID=UPI003531C8D2
MSGISTTWILFWICVGAVYSHILGNGHPPRDSIGGKPNMTPKQRQIFVVEMLPGHHTGDIPQSLLDRAPEMENAFDEEGGILGYLQKNGLLDTISKYVDWQISKLRDYFKTDVEKPNMPPVISCPRSFNVNSDPGRPTARVRWDEPTVSDREDPPERLTVRQTQGERNGAKMSGTVHVKYIVSDSRGRTDFCTFTVTVKRVMCQPIHMSHGVNNCSTNYVYHGTVCHLSCQDGYEVLGDSIITCKENGQFSSTHSSCKAIQCPVLKLPENAVEWRCGDENNFESHCDLMCKEGFRLESDWRAPWQIAGAKCQANKTWTLLPVCKDIRPPRITNCPSPFPIQYADKGRTSTIVVWEEIKAVDNSDDSVAIILKMGNESGSRFEVGSHEIRYHAVDEAGLTDECAFMVNVVTRSCRVPVFQHRRLLFNCPDQFTHGSICNVTCSHGITLLGASNISCELENGTLGWVHKGRTPTCDEKPCIDPENPPNSVLECQDFSGGRMCVMKCNEGYIRARNTMTSSLVCSPSKGKWPDESIYGCVRKREPSILETSLGYYWSARCTDEDIQNVTDTFEELMNLERFYSYCSMCTVKNIRAACKANRRGTRFMVVKMEVQKGILDTDDSEITEMAMSTVGRSLNVWLKRNLKTLNIIGRRRRVVSKNYPIIASCDPQYAADKTSRACAACAVGFEYDGQSGCRKCGSGTYQDDTGYLQCRRCPAGTFTITLGRSREDCRAPCPKGAFSATGLEPCSKCPIGQYQAHTRSTTCQSCVGKEVTPSVGSEQQSDCYNQTSRVLRLRVTDAGSTFVTLKWGMQSHLRENLTGFGSAFHKASEKKDTRTYLNDTSSDVRTVTIRGLEPLTEYTVYVWAIAVKGAGVERHLNVTTTNVTASTTQIPTTTTVDPTLCPPGTNSRSGRKGPDGTCKPCAYGFYQENRGRKKCKVCKQGFTTWYKGSTSRRDCVDKTWTTPTPPTTTAPPEPCDEGYVSETGFKPHCTVCPEEKKSNTARTECVWCDDDDPSCTVTTTTEPSATTATIDSVSDDSNRTDRRSTTPIDFTLPKVPIA